MNFIDYVIKKTDKYNKYGFVGLTKKEYQMLLALHCLNYRARRMKEELESFTNKVQRYNALYDHFENDGEPQEFFKMFNSFLELDTEMDEGYFDRIIQDPNKDKGGD